MNRSLRKEAVLKAENSTGNFGSNVPLKFAKAGERSAAEPEGTRHPGQQSMVSDTSKILDADHVQHRLLEMSHMVIAADGEPQTIGRKAKPKQKQLKLLAKPRKRLGDPNNQTSQRFATFSQKMSMAGVLR